MRAAAQSNAINRVLRARGLPSLEEAGAAEVLGRMVEDHQHLTELLRACDPMLRRAIYEAVRPHLRFTALPLDHYVARAQAYAAAAELPVMDGQGNLQPYSMPVITIEAPTIELLAQCSRCGKETIFFAEHKAGAIHTMRNSGWAYDESALARHMCPDCLEGTVL